MKTEPAFTLLTLGEASYFGAPDGYMQFLLQNALRDESLWRQFVQVFRSDCDSENDGWRCEYWGKMMRGACLIYTACGDAALYRVLEGTVRDLLTVQRPDGRFSTYAADHQLCGWDIWGRKYVLTGMMHFYRVCHDESLKAELLAALCRHADAILKAVGNGAGQTPITETSGCYGGVNSCSILEPMVDLWRLTGERRYLDFAEYIESTGGCRDGNLIELALGGQIMPYQYPEVKAYETISFFEGVLALYEVTGEARRLEAVRRFAWAVEKTDITVIGCCGCTHELFDHAAERQTLPADESKSGGIMQETCVTVTWMRLCDRLYRLTGEEHFLRALERSAWNAMYGSVNVHLCPGYVQWQHRPVAPLPFDSYSPLYNGRRGVSVGGYQEFPFGGNYGCCACIGAAGIALPPLLAVTRTPDGLTVGEYLNSNIRTSTRGGNPLGLAMTSHFPRQFDALLRLSLKEEEPFALRLRLPDYATDAILCVNGEAVECRAESGFVSLCRMWHDGDTVTLRAAMSLREVRLNGRTALEYGVLVLARDQKKENDTPDLTESVALLRGEDGKPVADFEPPLPGEQLRLRLRRADGKEPLLLTDYASCGKIWPEENNRISAWLNLL